MKENRFERFNFQPFIIEAIQSVRILLNQRKFRNG